MHPLRRQLRRHLPHQLRPGLKKGPVFVLIAEHGFVVSVSHLQGAGPHGNAVCLGAEHPAQQLPDLILAKGHECPHMQGLGL